MYWQKLRHMKTNMVAMCTKTYAWLRSISAQSVAESGTHILGPLRQWNNRFIFMYICDEYCLATWIATTEGNQLLAFDLQSISAVHGLGTWLALTEEIRVGALGLPTICAEYGVETRLSPTDRIRVLALDLQPICVENVHVTWLATNDEIRVFAFNVHHIFAEYCLETWLTPCEEFSVLSQLTASRRWKWPRNMTRAIQWISCIGTWPTVNLYWIS